MNGVQMRSWWKKHHHLIGYLMIVAAAMIAVEIHSYRTTQQIRDFARIDCEAGEVRTQNQRLVLTTLIRWAEQRNEPTADLVAAINRIVDYRCDR